MTFNPIDTQPPAIQPLFEPFVGINTKGESKGISIGDDKKLDILIYLLKMRTLTATHVKILVYSENAMRTVYAALKSLCDHGIISFHAYSKGRGIGNLERFYFLTKKGFDYLQSFDGNSNSEIGFRRYQDPFVNAYYDHRHKLLDFWVALLMESRKYASQYYLAQFIPEWDKFENQSVVMRYEAVNEEVFTIRPDATFFLRNLVTDQEVLFFVEIDTGSESVMSRDHACIHKRIQRYHQAFRFGAFRKIDPYFQKFTGARLLFITSTQERIDNILGNIRLEDSLSDAFLFTTQTEMWKRGVINGKYRKQGEEGMVGMNSKAINDGAK